MSSFTVFVDESPSRARIPSIPFTFTTLTPPLSPSIDKENVNPRGGRVASGPTKAKKRRYVREEGAGPLAAKRKAKALASAAATTAAASGSSSTARKSEKKPRRALLGKSNSSSGSSSSASTPLSTTPTLIEEALMDRRVFELTVSPLADASEAYIGTNLTPLIESCTLTEGTSPFPSPVAATDYFSLASLPSTPEKSRSVSPLVISPRDPALCIASDGDSTLLDMICLRIPLPPSPVGCS